MKFLRPKGLGAALAAAVLLAACGGPDPRNPESVAKAFMDAYRKQDPAGMLALMSPKDTQNRQILQLAITQGSAGDAHKEVFDPETLAIMTGKGTGIEGPRYDSSGRPAFKVAEDGGEAYIVLLTQADGKWSIDRLDNMSNEEFQALPAKGAGA